MKLLNVSIKSENVYIATTFTPYILHVYSGIDAVVIIQVMFIASITSHF
jgi:hypothetical protein